MGAVAKTFGVLLLIVGILLLLGGAGAAAYSYLDEEDNQDQFLRDGDRSDQNELVMLYGAIGAGAGLVLLIVGAVLLSVGGKVVVMAGGTPSKAKPATRPEGRRKATISVLAVVGAALVLAAIFAILAQGDESERGAFFRVLPGSDEGGILGSDTFNGTVEGGASTFLTGSVANGNNDHDLSAPAGTGWMSIAVEWTPETAGSERLVVIVSLPDGTEITRQAGTPGFTFEVTDAQVALSGAELHYRVFPADDAGVVASQAFTIRTEFWGY